MTGIDLLRALVAANPDSLHDEVIVVTKDGPKGLLHAFPERRWPAQGNKEFTFLEAACHPIASPFTLVRHPDTARLDWLDQNAFP